jgi:hypothetical protein
MMPVRNVWEEIAKRSKVKGFEIASLSDFSAMLEGDHRFQIVPGQIKVQDDEDAVPELEIEDSDMEQLGFFAEDRVKLRGKKNVETMLSDDEEEVGSIRRMSFARQTAKSAGLSLNKKPTHASKKTVAEVRKKKALPPKSKSAKRSPITKSNKLKAHKRGKK